MENHKEEPRIAPEANRWYNITLGPSLLGSYSPRFCYFRYEFKPASIDNTQAGSFQKSIDNKVTLEFQNNQPGKTKVRFDGDCEDYDDGNKDAILFFDGGQTLRLEKLHRAVKRLRCLRVPAHSGKGAQIDINNPISLVKDHENEDDPYPSAPHPVVYESEEDVNICDDEEDSGGQESASKQTSSSKEFRTGGLDIDINLPHPADMEDDEIADVDINDDESDKGLNAAEALRAQLNAEAKDHSPKSSTSSSDREIESSESGAESSESRSSESRTASESGSRTSH